MSGSRTVDDLLVGYAERDPLFPTIVSTRNQYGGRCVGCNRPVFFNPSAFERLSDRDSDPAVCCRLCWERDRTQIEEMM
jgi:hypothetical protein